MVRKPGAPASSASRPGVRLERLVQLCHHRWSLPVIADLSRWAETTVPTMANQLGTSRTLVRSTLRSLADLGLARRIDRNRYAPTRAGERAGRHAWKVLFALSRLRVTDLARRKWSLPVLVVLRDGPARFTEFRTLLPGITPRALASALASLEEAELIERRVVNARPPFTTYRLTGRGRRLASLGHGL